jgi:hypothetical protein
MPARLAACVAAIAVGVPAPAGRLAEEDPRRPNVPTEVAYPEVEEPEAGPTPAKSAVARPEVAPPDQQPVDVAIGLSPEAPGSKAEKDLLARLERSVLASPRPPANLRRLRPGAGDARLVCRERRDDIVILIGYLPDREAPVLLPHDCSLDRPLGVRATEAVDEKGLVGALWDEHTELLRQGARPRHRMQRLGPKARAGIIAGVALVVIGVAVGFLVAGALRKDTVVLKVEP